MEDYNNNAYKNPINTLELEATTARDMKFTEFKKKNGDAFPYANTSAKITRRIKGEYVCTFIELHFYEENAIKVSNCKKGDVIFIKGRLTARRDMRDKNKGVLGIDVTDVGEIYCRKHQTNDENENAYQPNSKRDGYSYGASVYGTPNTTQRGIEAVHNDSEDAPF